MPAVALLCRRVVNAMPSCSWTFAFLLAIFAAKSTAACTPQGGDPYPSTYPSAPSVPCCPGLREIVLYNASKPEPEQQRSACYEWWYCGRNSDCQNTYGVCGGGINGSDLMHGLPGICQCSLTGANVSDPNQGICRCYDDWDCPWPGFKCSNPKSIYPDHGVCIFPS